MNIADVDKNFKAIEVEETKFTLLPIDRFTLEGMPWENVNTEKFYRMPEDIIPKLNIGMKYVSPHTSGAVIRFSTDSKALLVKGTYREFTPMSHMPLTGSAGFDVMSVACGEEKLVANLKPTVEEIVRDKNFDFSFSCYLKGTETEYKIYLPLYTGIKELEIGLESGASLNPPSPHKIEKPIVFYGSSITQGGCASRPSNSYSALISSRLDAPQINLGFSGSAMGENEVAEAIAELDMSCFVYDYDHNAPSVEHLEKTHERFFEIIRNKNRDLPIIFVSRPDTNDADYNNTLRRRAVIMQTYLNQLAKGDKNVYFVDGTAFFQGIPKALPTVDALHPTDLGFYCMANVIGKVVKGALFNIDE